MKLQKLLAFVFVLIFCGRVAAQENPSRWTAADVIKQTTVSSPQFSPDGNSLVWVHRRPSQKKDRFVNDLWLTRLDALNQGKWPSVQLTRSEDSDFNPLFSEDGNTLYFLSSRKGGKSLWAMSVFGGDAFVVDSFPEGVSNLQWLNEHTFSYISGEGKTLREMELKKKKDNVVVVEDSAHMAVRRVFAYDLKTKQRKRLTDNQFPVSSYSVSKDGKWLVSRHVRSPHYAADGKPEPWYFIWNLETGVETQILREFQDPGRFTFTSDNGGFYFSVTQSSLPEWGGAGISLLHYFHLDRMESEQIDLDWEWGLSSGFSLFGNDLFLQLANGPTNKLMHLSKEDENWSIRPVSVGSMTDRINVMNVAKDGKQVAFAYSTASTPLQYRVGRIAEGSTTQISEGRIFAHINKHLEKKQIAKTEIVRWTGALDDEITGMLYYPHDYDSSRRYPLIVAIHGGPTGVDMDRWSDRWAYFHNLLVQEGCFILKPNYHGSSNHGQDFTESIKFHYYDYELDDVMSGIDMLDKDGRIDRDSLGLMGWSNGAIITTMLTVKYPGVFKVATPGAGDVNWTSDYGTCRFGVTFDQYYLGGAPWDDKDGKTYNQVYIDKSPLFEMDKVLTPTLIFHGSEDRAVPRDQGWEYYRALQQNGKAPVRFLWFPGQPHGLQKITHQTRKIEEEIAWFKQYLFKDYEAPNEALKKGSPLYALLENQAPAQNASGYYGEIIKGKLVPEVVSVKEDSIAIGRFELTNAQYKAFDKKHRFPAANGNYPVYDLSGRQIEAYLNWLSKLTGQTYRLPKAEEAKSLHKQARKVATKENSLNRWAGYAITPAEVVMLSEELAKLDKTKLLQSVGSNAPVKVGEAEIYDLGGNVAEQSLDGGTYGYSALDYVDKNDPKVESTLVGIRVVRE
ncbi:MAG: prolyl oligopeptidase family serine peptidase [Bacteroidota bacterium]